MNASIPAIFRTVGRYAAAFRTTRNEIRTERLLNSLPPSLRKDIGWPDRFARPRWRLPRY